VALELVTSAYACPEIVVAEDEVKLPWTRAAVIAADIIFWPDSFAKAGIVTAPA
jgi:hypothetical protein